MNIRHTAASSSFWFGLKITKLLLFVFLIWFLFSLIRNISSLINYTYIVSHNFYSIVFFCYFFFCIFFIYFFFYFYCIDLNNFSTFYSTLMSFAWVIHISYILRVVVSVCVCVCFCVCIHTYMDLWIFLWGIENAEHGVGGEGGHIGDKVTWWLWWQPTHAAWGETLNNFN